MHAAIEESLLTYPLDTSESALIHWDAVSNQVQDFMFMGDQTLFNHIFFNLLKNALHYVKSADRGEIKIWLATEGKHNFLHFMDTGTGISTASLPHIFDAFYTKTTHGTGVGLALCKVIMQEFGGEISCQSIEGQYTHFILKFPPLQKEL
jgi:signal transduction histidine kinase